MKCVNHHTMDAVGVCVNCGKALCKDCIKSPPGSGKVTCSYECFEAVNRSQTTIMRMHEKATKQHRIAAITCFMIAISFLFFAPLAFRDGLNPLATFFALISLALAITGFWQYRLSKDH